MTRKNEGRQQRIAGPYLNHFYCLYFTENPGKIQAEPLDYNRQVRRAVVDVAALIFDFNSEFFRRQASSDCSVRQGTMMISSTGRLLSKGVGDGQ